MRVPYDIVCLSHLRWDFVYQRPQQLLSRASLDRRVLFIEEPVFEAGARAELRTRRSREGVVIATPLLPRDLGDAPAETIQRDLIARLLRDYGIERHVVWLYTPMARPLTRELEPIAIVYDCMDELTAFKGAPPALAQREAELLADADVVFTGGRSLYHAKRHLHHNVHLFPSAVDFPHFASARQVIADASGQAAIPRPRLGYFGVIDERMDLELLAAAASLRPEVQFVMIGPVCKIEPADLPVLSNLHWLGQRSYHELPSYIAGWDAAILPFALNEATRYISPTKVPEYLAAGKPVISTAIRDVVHPYGEQGLVAVVRTAEEFGAAIDRAIREDQTERIVAADRLVRRMSWDHTWAEMNRLIGESIMARTPVPMLRSALAREGGSMASPTRALTDV